MNTGLLHLHSLLRWVIVITLLISIVKTFSGNKPLGISKILLISSHTTLLIGLYQYFFGNMGVKLFQQTGVMKDAVLRFWAVEHMAGMILAVALITIGHISLKKTDNTKKTAILYLIAFIVIIASIPWPFRADGIARGWFPGIH